MALRPKNTDIDAALKNGVRVRIGYHPSADHEDAARESYYGYAIAVEGGSDARYSDEENEDGVLIFVPGVFLDEFERDNG